MVFSQQVIHWHFCYVELPHSIAGGMENEKKKMKKKRRKKMAANNLSRVEGLADFLLSMTSHTRWFCMFEHSSIGMMTIGSDISVGFCTIIDISSVAPDLLKSMLSVWNWQCWFTFDYSRGCLCVFIYILLFSTLLNGSGNGTDLTPPSRQFGYLMSSLHTHVFTIAGLHSLLRRFW